MVVREQTPVIEDHSSEVLVGKKKHLMSEKQRRELLEADEYCTAVTPTTVTCLGCKTTIKLDKRNRYYPGLWKKHREKCVSVQALKVRTFLCDVTGNNV